MIKRAPHRRETAAIVLGVLGAALLPSLTQAQRFTFGEKKYQATPGATVDLAIYASQSTANISGANFTVRIAQPDAAMARLPDATSTPNPQLIGLGFNYADNRLGRLGVTSGEIRGTVQEFRGAVFSTSNPPLTVPANSPRLVATIHVPIDINASGRVLVELVSAVDNGVSLLGLANAAGDPIIPSGRVAPEGDIASIIIEPANTPLVTDLKQLENQSGWIYSSPLPAQGPGGTGEGLAGSGLSTQSVIDGTYTVWQWDFLNRGPWRSPAAGRLHVMDWTVRADVDGVETPPFRLRLMTTNSMLSAETLYQDLWQNNDSISMVPTPAGRTYRTITQVPQFAADGFGGDGLVPYFDMIQFDQIGKPGGKLTLEKLEERFVDPASLLQPKVEYFQTFDSRNDGGWKFTAGNLGGKEVSYSRGRYGLGITSGGALQTGTDGKQTFSYGYWHALPSVLKVKSDATRWYHLEADVHGTADNSAWNPEVRFRVYPSNNEYFNMLLFAPQIELDDFHVPRPDLDGETLSAWFLMPADVNGMDLGMAFDLIHVDAPTDGTDQKPAIFLKWVRITSFEAPTLP